MRIIFFFFFCIFNAFKHSGPQFLHLRARHKNADLEAGVLAQRIKSPSVMSAYHLRAWFPVPVAPPLIQLLANASENSRRWPKSLGPATHVGDSNGVPGSWF